MKSTTLLILTVLLMLAHGAPAGTLTPFRSRNYEVFTDAPLARARPVAEHMDAVYDEYQRRFRSFAAKNAGSVRLYVFGKKNDYHAFLRSKGVKAPNTSGVFFASSKEAGLATYLEGQSGERMYHVLQHEGFHQFAYLRIGTTLPQWANEGLAEYFGGAILVNGRLRLGVAPQERIDAVNRAITRGKAWSFARLLDMTDTQWIDAVGQGHRAGGGSGAGMLYDQAWSMVHFLIHADEGKYADAFGEFLRAVTQGRPGRDAFAHAFGSDDPGAFEAAWRGFMLDEIRPDAVSTALERLEFLGEGAKVLAKRGITVRSVQDMQRELVRLGFSLTRTSDGVSRTLRAADPEAFDPLPGDVPGRAVVIELTAPAGAGLPVGFRVSGLSIGIERSWEKPVGQETEPSPRVSFE